MGLGLWLGLGLGLARVTTHTSGGEVARWAEIAGEIAPRSAGEIEVIARMGSVTPRPGATPVVPVLTPVVSMSGVAPGRGVTDGKSGTTPVLGWLASASRRALSSVICASCFCCSRKEGLRVASAPAPA